MNFLTKKTKSGLKKGGIFVITIVLLFSYSFPAFSQVKNHEVLDKNLYEGEPIASRSLESDLPLGETLVGSQNYKEAGDVLPPDKISSVYPQPSESENWSMQERQSPRESRESTLIYDPVNERAIHFGGRYCDYSYCYHGNDTWALNLEKDNEAWEKINTVEKPGVRDSHSAVYDTQRERMIIYGGEQEGTGYLRDAWALDLTKGQESWQELSSGGLNPYRLSDHIAVYDSIRDRMIVFSGAKQVIGDVVQMSNQEILVLNFSDSKEGNWEVLYPQGPFPSKRDGARGIFDPINNRLVIFGGYSWNGDNELNDTWVLDFSDSAAGQWTNLNPSGNLPSPRWNSSLTFDTARQLLILFGGVDITNGQSFNDLWIMNLKSSSPRWIKINPNGEAPRERGHHELIYDATNNRPIIYGGSLNESGWILDTYTDTHTVNYNSGQISWERLKPWGEGRRELAGDPVTIYDSQRNRLILHGGLRCFFCPSIADDQIYTLDLNQANPVWRFYQSSGIHRFDHEAIYDPVTDRMIFYGGQDGTYDSLNKIHLLNLSSEDNEWQTLDLPNPPAQSMLLDFSLNLDPINHRVILFGGAESPDFEPRDQVWALDLTEGQEYWYQIVPEGTIPGRWSHSAIYDPDGQRLIIYGGHNGTILNDVWTLDLTPGQEAWTELQTSGEIPDPHYDQKAIYDSNRQQMIILGGITDDRNVFALDLETLVWKKLKPFDENPPAQNSHNFIYDPVKDRGILLTSSSGGFSSDDNYFLLNLDFDREDPTAFQEQEEMVVMEAEHFHQHLSRNGHLWEPGDDGFGWDGEGYRTANPDDNTNYDASYSILSPELNYQINFTNTGTYYVWIRGNAPATNGDSIHAGLDGEETESANRIDNFTLNNWSWSNHTKDGPDATIQINEAGIHTLNLWMREDGLSVDKIILTTDPLYVPSGIGQDESPRE